MLKGFVSVEASLFGGSQKYLDLTSIHVSEDMRGTGIGRELFLSAKKWAKGKGAAKLYISAHSSVETQAFYRKWDAWRHRPMTGIMLRQNLSTASWNALYKEEKR